MAPSGTLLKVPLMGLAEVLLITINSGATGFPEGHTIGALTQGMAMTANPPVRYDYLFQFFGYQAVIRNFKSSYGSLPSNWTLDVGCSMFVSQRGGPVAQRLEQGTHNPLVPGSNPGGPSPSVWTAAKREGRHAVTS